MKSNNAITHTPQELFDEMKALASEAQAMMGNSITEHSAEAMAQLRERFEDAQARFADVYDNAKKKVVAGARSTDDAIRENPYQALAIAAGVGLLVGLLVGRRSK
jgi:ElaB/YqjD/DUF883 family membrane-anchored ribosome-binding protein